MTKEEFISQLDRAAATMPGLPVSTALVRHLSEALKKGDPPWWQLTQKAWEKRSFVAWTEAWGLFLACLHYEVLSDAENPLVPYFPSCGGTDEADPSSALAQVLRALPKTFFDNLRVAQRRTYVEARAPLWINPAMLFFQSRNLSFYLVEVNAGAGLNLVADLAVPQRGFNPELVAARIGLEPTPLLLEDIGHRRWLTAALMPDQLPLIKALDKAIDVALQRQRQEAAFIQIVPCWPDQAAKFLAKNIPADDPDVGLLLFNMGTTVRMTDAEYEAYRRGVAEALRPWGDRGLWVEMENVRGEMYSTTYQLRAHRHAGGQWRGHVMASFDFAADKTVFDLDQSKVFLS
ncbi:MAG: DUF2332 family protein [Elusimicrobia bacterium]|nr:DUF2332 family protein [Elusimicrobiota bacterium]